MIITQKPILFHLQLTGVCQLKCVGCTNAFASGRDRQSIVKMNSTMPLSNWVRILETIKPFVGRIVFTGGEPTLYSEFEDLLVVVIDWEIPFSILTNGIWPRPQKLINILSNAPEFRNLHISLHGSDPDSHEAFTGIKNSFNKVVSNIRLATNAGIRVSTGTVVTPWNFDKAREIVELGEELKVGLAMFNRYVGEDWANAGANQTQLINCIRSVNALKKEGKSVKFSACIPQCFEGSTSQGCLASLASCAIDPWGNILPCIHTALKCGNLFDKSIYEIWHSSEMQSWRDLVPDACTSCGAFSQCGGGCRADVYAHNNNQDSLMLAPIQSELPISPSNIGKAVLSLPSNARIIPRFQVEKSNVGYVLYKGATVIPVHNETISILATIIEQDYKLADVEREFGSMALSVIGVLFEKDLIHLHSEQSH